MSLQFLCCFRCSVAIAVGQRGVQEGPEQGLSMATEAIYIYDICIYTYVSIHMDTHVYI